MDTQPVKRSNWRKELREWGISLSLAIIFALLFQNYVYAQSEVHNISMQNTLIAGQRLIEDKWSYKFKNPEHGDIVIINGPESDMRLVKRVIGLPGDVIDIHDGSVFLNGERINEPYTKGLTTSGSLVFPYIVESDKIFVMGDNREHSEDSRDLGPIAFSSIEGKVVYRIWPIAKFGEVQ
ncbi:signal peptidase I [Paenibacillus sp. NEAU-GSW1]|uniref:signal peptidase I n=1 Tax=Paenibacillus sp. NEAU-GSW1 TaxID=2682486 RepID=UPI0012E328BB|nr:signal peptidase I [Paenibacillus sp. NEAU-GSW1]MUT66440.1 signal peptidase I [Paenibacillus sp. NEAU-GSW1]